MFTWPASVLIANIKSEFAVIKCYFVKLMGPFFIQIEMLTVKF